MTRALRVAIYNIHKSLDRICVRGFQVRHARVHHGRAWARVSDHAALTTTWVHSQ